MAMAVSFKSTVDERQLQCLQNALEITCVKMKAGSVEVFITRMSSITACTQSKGVQIPCSCAVCSISMSVDTRSCWVCCLEVVHSIFHAGSAAEGHNDGVIIPGDQHLIIHE